MDLSLDLNPSSPTYRDLLLQDGDLVLTRDGDPRGAHPVLQNILQRLRMFRGEWFLGTHLGVPYYQQILVKGANRPAVDNLLKAVITGTPGVMLLTAYQSKYNGVTRALSVSFSCTTRMGQVSYDGPLNYAGGMVVQ